MLLRKTANAFVKVYFTALAFMMYFFINEVAYVGGIGVTYRHIFALAIVASAFLLFLASPDVSRGAVSLKSALVYALPLLVVLVSSMLVWVVDKSDISTIMRGISGCMIYTNQLSCALAAAALLYVFGEDGIWYNMLALVSANLFMIVRIMLSDGIAAYMKEFFVLLFSFAGNTGEVIVKAEIHELAFCIGVYLIYMLFKPKKKLWFWLLFGAASFCFLSALKRIAVVAMAVVVFIALVMRLAGKLSKRTACVLANTLMIVFSVLLVAYIAAIKAGVFTVLENAGIDTSGRAYVYSHVDGYYRFSPSFVGNGIGFLTYRLNEVDSLGVSAVHNDFLQFYIDLGFFGYILWILSMTLLRTAYFGRKGDGETATVAALLIVYLIIVSSTDNTINYPLLTTVIGVLIIGNKYNEKASKQSEYFETHPFGV